MKSYKNVIIVYQNPDELKIKSQFKIDDNIFVSTRTEGIKS